MPDYTVKADVDTMLRADNKAAIRSAIGVGQTDAPTFLAQTLTGQSLTSSQSTNLLDLATTWDTVGTPSLIYGRVTDNNSGPSANLIDLGTFAGGSLFKVSKIGALTITSIFTAPTIYGTVSSRVVSDTGFFAIGAVSDTFLYRDASGILAQRNGVAKQALRVYNTNLVGAPEWAEFDWITSGIGNTLRIGTNLSGTGGARPIEFVVGGVVRWTIATSGNATFTGGLTIGSSAAFSHSGRVLFTAPSVGVYLLQNNTQDDFNRLQLGGTTSAFPAIKRTGTGIDIVLANDSAFAPISSLYQRFGTNTPEGSVTAPIGAVYHRTDGAAGTSFYVKESTTGNTGWVAK